MFLYKSFLLLNFQLKLGTFKTTVWSKTKKKELRLGVMVETWSILWNEKRHLYSSYYKHLCTQRLDTNLESFGKCKWLNFKRKLEYFRPRLELRQL